MSTNEGKLENEEDLINEYGLKSEVDLKHKGDIKMTVTQVKGQTQKSLPAASTIHTPPPVQTFGTSVGVASGAVQTVDCQRH